jgi:hypothetical protein
MTIQAKPTRASIEQLAAAFNRCFETLDAPADLFTPDVFVDLYPPFWHFQVEGREAFGEQLRAIASPPVTARVLRVVPSETGFLLEHEETQHGADEVARRLWLCEVRDGRIAEVVGYCNGGWDAALRARHAAEAPMLRP